jgi:nitrite reductase/ring-hydroxylating ferredoxin subunit/Fe-S cluster biogenesis protein NfuA
VDFEKLAEAVDVAIKDMEKLEPEAKKKARQVKQAVEDFHKPGLTAIVKALKSDPRGKELLFELVDDPSVKAIFALHGLIRVDPTTHSARVLEMVRPYMQSHGGDVELVKIEGDTAFVRLLGSCNGCSMSAVTLRDGVTEALVNNVPSIQNVEVVPNEPTAGVVSVASIGMIERGWLEGPSISDVPSGKAVRVEGENGDSAVVMNLENNFFAYRNACAHQGLPLDGGMVDVEAGTLTCPWHGFCFDARSGECFTAPAAQLEPLPLRVDKDKVWVRLGSEVKMKAL